MKMTKRLVASVLSVVLLLTMFTSCVDNSERTVTEQAAYEAATWVNKNVDKYTYGAEWAVLALARSEFKTLDNNIFTTYETNLEKYLNKNYFELRVNDEVEAAGYPRTILAYTAIGKYANTSIGTDFVMGISWSPLLEEQGVYGTFYALIAIDCGNYEFHENGDVSREELLADIVLWQHEDGGFGPDGERGTSDVYTTAIALQALSNYQNDVEIKEVTEKALAYLQDEQLATGAFGKQNKMDLQATAQVVIALTELGTNPDDFGTGNMMQELLNCQNEDGSFSYENEADMNTTVDVLLALAAYNRMVSGKVSLYDMSDVYGATHNKLTGNMKTALNSMLVLTFGLIALLLFILIRSRLIIRKWRKDGIYNEDTKSKMTPAEAEIYHKAKEKEANNGGTEDGEAE